MYVFNSVIILGLCAVLSVEETDLNMKKSIIDEPKCAEVRNLCVNLSENDDLLIIECLLSQNPVRLSVLHKECQNIIWNHLHDLVKNDRVQQMLSLKHCAEDLKRLNCKTTGIEGDYLKCIVNRKDDVRDGQCNQMVVRLENVAFQNFRWISGFLPNCNEDIDRFSCNTGDSLGAQSQTISCLQSNILNIRDDCKREVLKLSELQGDNIRLDRQLYLACIEDHSRYCQQFSLDSAHFFECLMSQPSDRLSVSCRNQLLKRQKLIAQDYGVSKGLIRACRDDIKKTHCRRQTSTSEKTVRLAQILLCLENTIKNGSKLDPDCEVEMVVHRKMLMEDYRLSPEIVDGCKEEIHKFCQGLEIGGRTIHCLMDHARLKNVKKRIGDTCQRAVETLLKETDAGEDWRVDPVLHEACNPVVRTVCRDVKGGDARVMSCLMDKMEDEHMTEECEDAIMQIQYFIARDFNLDPQLYRQCQEDAVRFCHATNLWDDTSIKNRPNYGPQVLPCLYRYAYGSDPKQQIKKSCLQQIQRVMRQRAISVDLQPEIEEVCLNDLSLFCFDKTRKGEEMQCLQKNFDDLQDKCRKAIEEFTEIEAEHIELNPYIMTNCRKEMEILCSAELNNDEGNVMDCLIQHKNHPTIKGRPACRASIEHFQLISLKKYEFNYKFKMACKKFALRFCVAARTKSEVVQCLSEKITNDTIKGLKSDIPKECRQQLKSQLFQQRENIDFDPKLKAACENDIKKYCPNVEHGSAQVLECLQTLHGKLSENCGLEVFKVKKQDFYDNSIDYSLMTTCADAIDQFCPQHDKETILECLKLNKDQKGFNKKCRLVVIHRMIEQNTNYQLNPSLQENCKLDINKFCSSLLIKNKQIKDLNGAVIKCLKASFKKSNLSNKCQKEMVNILHEQALDINLNPLIRVVCKNELETICKYDIEDSRGKSEECLKNALLEKRIATPECQIEVANLIEESQADIQVDPLLQQVCALDLLKFCNDIPQGNGRHVKCLKIVMSQSDKHLSPDCRSMLLKRFQMYENAARIAPLEDFHQLYNQMVTSPARHYFILVIFMMFASIFVMGLFFGRAFKRHINIKNK